MTVRDRWRELTKQADAEGEVRFVFYCNNENWFTVWDGRWRLPVKIKVFS